MNALIEAFISLLAKARARTIVATLEIQACPRTYRASEAFEPLLVNMFATDRLHLA